MAINQTYDELKQRVKVLEKEAGNRKRAEEALRESEERYRLLTDNVTDVIWVRDMNLRFTYISPSVTKMTGYSVEEAIAFSLEDVYTPASIEVARNALAEELAIEKIGNADPFRVRTVELEGFCKDGSMIWTEAKMSFLRGPAGQVVGIFGVSRDISQRRQVEEALRESEKRYRSILETAPHSITITRVKDGRYLQVNEAFCQIRGYSREEVLGRTPFELKLYVNPEDRESLINILKEKGEVNGFEVQYQKRDGTAIDTLLSARPLEYENEDCLIEVITDITELKRTEEALRKSEKKYRDLVENINDVIYSIDKNGVMTYISPAVESILGYSPSEIINKPLIEFVYREDLTRMKKRFEETLSGHIKPSEYRILSKSGEIHWILASSKPVFIANHVIGIQGVLKDITERKQAEVTLQEKEQKLERQAQRLEEVNTALKVLLEHRGEEKKKSEENILSNVQKLIFPYIEKMENSRLNGENETYLSIIRSNLKDLISPFGNTLSSKYSILTPTEIQVADLTKHGKTSKEIASLLNVSLKAISFHRGNIRKKLGLVNKKRNLRSHLQSLAT